MWEDKISAVQENGSGEVSGESLESVSVCRMNRHKQADIQNWWVVVYVWFVRESNEWTNLKCEREV